MTDDIYGRGITFVPPSKGTLGQRRVLECDRCGRQAVVFEENALVLCTGPEDRPHPPESMGRAASFGAIG